MKTNPSLKCMTWSIGAALLLGMTNPAFAKEKGSDSHGGDIQCDAKVKKIAANIQIWIQNHGPAVGNLNLASSLNPSSGRPFTVTEYSAAMLDLLGKSLDVRCVKAGDPDYPVLVDGSPKVCKNEIDGDTIRMVCDRELLLGMDEDQQIEQIHHEYATDVPGLEPDYGPLSTYLISIQLALFTDTVSERRLVVGPGLKLTPRSAFQRRLISNLDVSFEHFFGFKCDDHAQVLTCRDSSATSEIVVRSDAKRPEHVTIQLNGDSSLNGGEFHSSPLEKFVEGYEIEPILIAAIGATVSSESMTIEKNDFTFVAPWSKSARASTIVRYKNDRSNRIFKIIGHTDRRGSVRSIRIQPAKLY